MRKILAICLSLATHLHAGNTSHAPPISELTTAAPVESIHDFTSTTTQSQLFDMDSELKKIADICLTDREHELLAGDILKQGLARVVNAVLVGEAQQVIGLEELRNVLGFAPLGPWTNYTEPSKKEIEAASTIEEYYTLREPRSPYRSLDSDYFHEKNFPPAIAFLDKRIPTVRTIYQKKFAEIRSRTDAKEAIDRKEVDHMIQEYIAIVIRMDKAFGAWSLIGCRLRELEELRENQKKTTMNPVTELRTQV
ncbi:hypothetical protein CAEBREN_10922 [Caenorhabditis brenneri]|uniref:Uncharacterized protein n=1 Tax=Caenorhabditis brenneri TaxID=135651 RepID=G0P400_CAEBE|nr:hypothetical protein CAEBREN_10922 [Caenorhabditis brenneri]